MCHCVSNWQVSASFHRLAAVDVFGIPNLSLFVPAACIPHPILGAAVRKCAFGRARLNSSGKFSTSQILRCGHWSSLAGQDRGPYSRCFHYEDSARMRNHSPRVSSLQTAHRELAVDVHEQSVHRRGSSIVSNQNQIRFRGRGRQWWRCLQCCLLF
jgi:hypothetical protein